MFKSWLLLIFLILSVIFFFLWQKGDARHRDEVRAARQKYEEEKSRFASADQAWQQKQRELQDWISSTH